MNTDRLRLFLQAPWGIAFGAIGALAMPPVLAWYVLPLSIGWLWLAVCHASGPRQAALSGWCWGFGFFTAGLYWIGNALMVDAGRFAWMLPFSVFGLPAVLGAFTALHTCLAQHLRLTTPLAFAILFTLCEMLRGWAFTGFPWNPMGLALHASNTLIQAHSIWGIYGSSALVCWLAIAPIAATRRRNPKTLISASIVLFLLLGFGGWRLQQPVSANAESINLRLVQASIPQSLKWDEEARADHVWTQINLSKSAPLDQIDAVIWPETAVPFFLGEHEPELLAALQQAVPPGGVLLTGAMHAEAGDDQKSSNIYNSLFAIDASGIASRYDKRHLVPFGEFIPFRKWVPLVSLVYNGGDFTRGQGSAALRIPNLPTARPLICYEAIFTFAPELTSGDWFLNVTNDAWFGQSPGPHQHLEMARARAVEYGKPMLRVANTGISEAWDAQGRSLGRMGLNEKNILDVHIQKNEIFTIYSRLSVWVTLPMIGYIIGMLLYRRINA